MAATPDTPRASTLMVVAAFAAIYLVWGSTFLAIRFALESFPPFLMMGIRWTIAGCILLTFAMARGAAPPTRAQWLHAAIIGALLFLVSHGALAWSETRVASGVAALMLATIPLFMALAESIGPRGERPGLWVTIGLATGFGGVMLLVLPGGMEGAVDPLGALLLVLSAIAWIVGSLLGRDADRPNSGTLAVALPMVTGGSLLLLAALVTGDLARFDVNSLSMKSTGSLVYLIVGGSLVGFTAYWWLLKVTSPTRVASYGYVNPVVAVMVGWALGGETLSTRIVIAAAVIVVSVALVVTRSSKTARSRGRRGDAAPREGGEPKRTAEVIARVWQGTTPAGAAAQYERYLENTGLRGYRTTAGNRGALILRRENGPTAEFVVLSLWDSWDAVRRFAGDDVERAVYYPEDEKYLVELTPTVSHYQVVDGDDQG